MARTILGVDISDPMAGYFALRRQVFERARPRISPRGFKIMLEIFCLSNPQPYTEIGYAFRCRHAGQSKLSTRVMWQYMNSLLELRKKI